MDSGTELAYNFSFCTEYRIRRREWVSSRFLRSEREAKIQIGLYASATTQGELYRELRACLSKLGFITAPLNNRTESRIQNCYQWPHSGASRVASNPHECKKWTTTIYHELCQNYLRRKRIRTRMPYAAVLPTFSRKDLSCICSCDGDSNRILSKEEFVIFFRLGERHVLMRPLSRYRPFGPLLR